MIVPDEVRHATEAEIDALETEWQPKRSMMIEGWIGGYGRLKSQPANRASGIISGISTAAKSEFDAVVQLTMRRLQNVDLHLHADSDVDFVAYAKSMLKRQLNRHRAHLDEKLLEHDVGTLVAEQARRSFNEQLKGTYYPALQEMIRQFRETMQLPPAPDDQPAPTSPQDSDIVEIPAGDARMQEILEALTELKEAVRGSNSLGASVEISRLHAEMTACFDILSAQAVRRSVVKDFVMPSLTALVGMGVGGPVGNIATEAVKLIAAYFGYEVFGL
jgi:hypothetical protein